MTLQQESTPAAAPPVDHPPATAGPRRPSPRTVLTAVLAAAVVAVLLRSRLDGLRQSLWHDEAFTVLTYVQPGPRAVFGHWIPNDHMLFELLTWTTTRALGSSELTWRLWSVGPALVATLAGGLWLARREGRVAALAFLVTCTAVVPLADLSRQARGYGLCFAAMVLMVLSAWSLVRDPAGGRARWGVAAGVLLGTLTLPVFVLPAIGVLLVLLACPATRRRCLLLPVLTGVPTALFYAPVLGDVLVGSHQEYGARLPWWAVLGQPVGSVQPPEAGTGPAQVLWYAAVLVLLAAGAVALVRRDRWSAALLLVPSALTVLGITAARLYTTPRFINYLVVPSALLVAVGCQAVVTRARASSDRLGDGAAVALTATGALALGVALGPLDALAAQPKEAFQEVGRFVAQQQGAVLTDSRRATGLQLYVEQPLQVLTVPQVAARVCDGRGRLVVVDHPYLNAPLPTDCLQQRGAELTRFEQSSRGGHLDVWVVPPRR